MIPSPPQETFERNFVQTLATRLKEENPLIQVILGPRQVGKTTGVLQWMSHYSGKIHYNSADEALAHSSEWISQQWQTALTLGPSPVLIIDEIQKVLNWSSAIKNLWDSTKRQKKIIKLVLLGSSSLDLHQGLEESLAGRFEIIPAPHWGFEESQLGLAYSLEDYLLFGGYPAALRFKQDFDRWQSYLKNSIIETVIGKDILRQKTVKNPGLFRQAFEILASYPAQEMSYNKILGQLQEKGNIDLVKHYIHLFEGAFLFRALHKYSGSKQIQKSSSPKILPLCPSLYTFQLGAQDLVNPEIRGRILEACVGSELSQLPGELFYWREGPLEVDFVYSRGSTLIAIEVKSGRRKREGGLTAFQKEYRKTKKIFITSDNFDKFSKNPSYFLEQFST